MNKVIKPSKAGLKAYLKACASLHAGPYDRPYAGPYAGPYDRPYTENHAGSHTGPHDNHHSSPHDSPHANIRQDSISPVFDKLRNCVKKMETKKFINESLDIAKIRDGANELIKNKHNEIIAQETIAIKRSPQFMMQPSRCSPVLVLDGTQCRTTRALIRAGVNRDDIYVINSCMEIVHNLKNLGVNAYCCTLEEFLSDERTQYDMLGRKFSAVYLDSNATLTGSVSNGYPLYVIEALLELYVMEGSLIALTTALRGNPGRKGNNEEKVEIIKSTIKSIADKKWNIELSRSEIYGKMHHIWIKIGNKIDDT